MAAKSDVELQGIIENKDKYQEEAYIAAIEELDRRQLAPKELIAEKEEIIDQQEKEQEINEKQEEIEQGARKLALKESLSLLIPSNGNFFTPIIVYVNVFIFLIMVLSGVHVFEPSVESLIAWGGNLRELSFAGEQWRLLTNIFLHGGIIHLVFNMYALLHVGVILESEVGKSRYLFAYIATGIIASAVSISVNDNIVSVGASGAIFGMYGLFLSLLILKVLDIPKETQKTLRSSILLFIGYNIFFGFTQEGIDNAAHIGGLISGLAIGFIYLPSFKQPKYFKGIALGITVFVIALILVLPKVTVSKIGEFQTAMKEFSVNEEKALWMYRENLSFIPEAKIQFYHDRLQKEGIDLWKENLKLVTSLKDLPSDLQKRVDLMKKYCDLRIETCQIMQASLNGNQMSDQLRIAEINREIDGIIVGLQLLNQK